MRLLLSCFVSLALAGCGARSDVLGYDAGSGGAGGSGVGGSGAGGSGGTGGTGGSVSPVGGSAQACSPGTEIVCYGGPPGTLGVGECQSGYAQCAPDGSGFGPCIGQKLPAPDDCNSPADEDCDGKTLPCGAEWAVFLGSEAFPIGVAADADGSVVVLGGLLGSVDFGDGLAFSTQGTADLFLVRLSGGGSVLWARHFPTQGFDVSAIGSVSIDAEKNLVIAGGAPTAIDFGAGGVAGDGGFVAKLDPNGQVLWAQRTQDSWSRAAVDPKGNIVSAGWQQCGDFFTCGDSVHVAQHGPSGDLHWSNEYAQNSWFHLMGVAVDSNGASYVSGELIGAAQIGSQLVTCDMGCAFLAKHDAGGGVVWAKGFVDTKPGGLQIAYPIYYGVGPTVAAYDGSYGPSAHTVAVTPNDDVLLAGTMQGSISFGGPLLTGTPSSLFLARLDAQGDLLWNRNVGGPLMNTPPATSVTAGGQLFVSGFTIQGFGGPGELDFGGGGVGAGLGVGRLGGDGAHVSSKGAPADYMESWLVTDDDPAGGMFFAVRSQSTLSLAGTSGEGMVIARLNP